MLIFGKTQQQGTKMCWTYAVDAMVSVELFGAAPSQPASRSRHLDAPWSPKTKLLLSGPAGRDTPKAWDDLPEKLR